MPDLNKPIESPDRLLEPVPHTPQPIQVNDNGLNIKPKKKFALKIVGALFLVVIITIVGALIWYKTQLLAINNDKNQLKKITIISGSTPDDIGKLLQKNAVIRNNVAFDVYLRLSGKNSKLQAGTYRLSPSESTPQIVDHLVSGSIDKFSITFLPGATLADAKKVLKNAGFSESEINEALTDTYDSPLLAGKPANADLEGYIYGETYNFNTGATVKEILSRVFAEYYSKIKESNLISGFTNNGLSLYQAITLASIIQREVNTASDQKQVAQVFYKRLHSDMALGSDVTYQYIADKTGVKRDVDIDSPYNTRLYKGLPPGPISTPGLSALQAVASPASGDYLYFLSGDDDITYFAHTNEEHEANIKNHCKIKCSVQ